MLQPNDLACFRFGHGDAGLEAALWREGVMARLAAGERLVLRAEGQSMGWVVRDGAHVVVRALPPEGPAVGDVVLAVTPTRAVLHRVLARRGDRVLLKGDANPRPDGWVGRAQIVGAVAPGLAPRCLAFASRHGGRLFARLTRWLARATR